MSGHKSDPGPTIGFVQSAAHFLLELPEIGSVTALEQTTEADRQYHEVHHSAQRLQCEYQPAGIAYLGPEKEQTEIGGK